MYGTHIPSTLPLKDRILSEIILDVELEVQVWYSIAYSIMLHDELTISLQ